MSIRITLSSLDYTISDPVLNYNMTVNSVH